MIRLGHAMLSAALGLWAGGLIALALAAPIIFRTAGSRPLAGQIFGNALRAYVWVEIALALVAAVGYALSRPATRIDWARGAVLAVMIALLATYAFWLHPAIAAERGASAGAQPTARFHALHRLSERLVGANLFLGLALLAWTLASRRP